MKSAFLRGQLLRWIGHESSEGALRKIRDITSGDRHWMLFLWSVTPCGLVGRCKRLENRTASILRTGGSRLCFSETCTNGVTAQKSNFDSNWTRSIMKLWIEQSQQQFRLYIRSASGLQWLEPIVKPKRIVASFLS